MDVRKDNLQDFYTKCLEDLKHNKKYFNFELVQNIPMKLECTESAYNWILNYKPNVVSEAKILFKEFESQISFQSFLVLYFFCFWIVKDILNILPYLSRHISSSLNIGAGMGFIDIFLCQLYENNPEIFLVELKEMRDIIHWDKTKEKLSQDLNTLDLLIDNISLNNVKNVNVYDSDSINKIKQDKKTFDLIISLKSWCFLYDVQVYSELVKSILSPKGFLICDVSQNRVDEFSKEFKILHIIDTYKLFVRVLAVNNCQ
jgi:hypothetical protein